jgi:hypothetical protein
MTASTHAETGSTSAISSSAAPVRTRSAASCSLPAHTISSTSRPGRCPALNAVARYRSAKRRNASARAWRAASPAAAISSR